jgi:hypothetical protein
MKYIWQQMKCYRGRKWKGYKVYPTRNEMSYRQGMKYQPGNK